MDKKNIYEEARQINNIDECYFYHTIDIPGHGVEKGEWDLRDGVRDYLGNISFAEKQRVLECGTASGFLCFWMERMGADVVAQDLSEKQSWDLVPYYGVINDKIVSDWKNHINKINNSFWFCHKAFNSNAKVIYCSIYKIPEEIGMVDITTFGSILLHLRDPFFALQVALRLTRKTVVITEKLPMFYTVRKATSSLVQLLNRGRATIVFCPQYSKKSPMETWWQLTPEIVINFIKILGFENIFIRYHKQLFMPAKRNVSFFTIVGHRTKPIEKPAPIIIDGSTIKT